MTPLQVPDRLAYELPRRAGERGQEWLRTLPDRVHRVTRRWNLHIGEPFLPGGVWGLVRRTSGGVVKLAPQIDESAHEGAALIAWGGNGAVEVYDFDADEGALLLERCVPGSSLEEERDLHKRDEIATSVIRS